MGLTRSQWCRLEAKNWIRRTSDPKDRRANRVYLTGDVRPMLLEMREHAAAVRQQALAGLTEQQHEFFVDALLLIKDNLQQPPQAADQIAGKPNAIGASQHS